MPAGPHVTCASIAGSSPIAPSPVCPLFINYCVVATLYKMYLYSRYRQPLHLYQWGHCLCVARAESHEALNMYFCFRWLLVHFKREFSLNDVMRIWEVPVFAVAVAFAWRIPLGSPRQIRADDNDHCLTMSNDLWVMTMFIILYIISCSFHHSTAYSACSKPISIRICIPPLCSHIIHSRCLRSTGNLDRPAVPQPAPAHLRGNPRERARRHTHQPVRLHWDPQGIVFYVHPTLFPEPCNLCRFESIFCT